MTHSNRPPNSIKATRIISSIRSVGNSLVSEDVEWQVRPSGQIFLSLILFFRVPLDQNNFSQKFPDQLLHAARSGFKLGPMLWACNKIWRAFPLVSLPPARCTDAAAVSRRHTLNIETFKEAFNRLLIYRDLRLADRNLPAQVTDQPATKFKFKTRSFRA